MLLRYSNKPITETIQLPASKSISNRVLIIQALCKNTINVKNVSTANDTQLLQKLLTEINSLKPNLVIDAEDAGTVYRFLTSYLAIQQNRTFTLTGSERMCERPIGDLVEALITLGADITYLNKKGFPPLLIHGKEIKGGKVKLDASTSSQFVSSLCLVAPTFSKGINILQENTIVSESYLDMTLGIMNDFGIDMSYEETSIDIPHAAYQSIDYDIENDWSSATFFYCMLIMMEKNSTITLNHLHEYSTQGDAMIAEIAEVFGIKTMYDDELTFIKKINEVDPLTITNTYNLESFPDLAIPFIVLCAIKYPFVKLTGIHHLEYKESQRLTALTTELKKLNIELVYQQECLSFIHHSKLGETKSIQFNTYNDHRIAMALSMVALLGIEVELDNTDCVNNSFPTYWEEIKKIGFELNP
jgi:3-phosphoshikimate 1-carboxyvinyltransferase